MSEQTKSINGYFDKNVISARLTPDTIALIDENFELITGGTKEVTGSRLIENLLDMALSKTKPNTETINRIKELENLNQERSEKIRMLENSILNLQGDQENSDQIIAEKKTILMKLQDDFSRVSSEKSDLESRLKHSEELLKAANNKSLPDGTILVNLSAAEKKVVESICSEESKRTGKEVTPEILLKNVFFFILVNGPHDVFAAPVSIRRVREFMTPETVKES